MQSLTFAEIMSRATSMSSVTDAEYERVLNHRQRISPRAEVECEKCGNHEYFFVVRNGTRYTRQCECKSMRDNLARISRSGLQEQLKRCTFANFQTPEQWQQEIKARVLQFCKDQDRGWLFIAGQSGCGKTHLCTAAAGKFLKSGADTRYMCWIDESIPLKALTMDETEYTRRISKFKTCKVLYIDDFLKTQRGTEPTQADIRLAFDILDYRYRNRKQITILSSERFIDEILNIDPALGGRIYEMSRKYRMEISNQKDRNWRLRM